MTYLCDARHHEVREHLNVVVVLEAVLHVAEKLEDVETVNARVEEGVHALEGRLPKVEAVVDLVLERTHLHLANQFFAFLKIWRDEIYSHCTECSPCNVYHKII